MTSTNNPRQCICGDAADTTGTDLVTCVGDLVLVEGGNSLS